MEFKDRLKEYREELKIKTKQEMANKLNITRSLYSMLENGARKPSQDVLDKLVRASNKPEEYWIYGITQEKEYLEKRDEFKSTKRAYKELKSLGLAKDLSNLDDTEKHILLLALSADLKHLEEKEKYESKE